MRPKPPQFSSPRVLGLGTHGDAESAPRTRGAGRSKAAPVRIADSDERAMSRRLNLATAKYIAGFIGLSSVYTVLSHRRKQLHQLSKEGRRSVILPRELPGHFVRALRWSQVPAAVDELSQLSGLWLGFYTGSTVLMLTGSGDSISAEHLTGSGLLPAGSPAFEVRRQGDAAAGLFVGQCTASLLFGGLLQLQLPCQVTACRHASAPGGSEAAAAADDDEVVITLDCQIASFLPWLRVPMRRIPAATYIPRDERGYVRGPGVAEAVHAVEEAERVS